MGHRTIAAIVLVCGLLFAADASAWPLFPRPYEDAGENLQDLYGVAPADFDGDGALDMARPSQGGELISSFAVHSGMTPSSIVAGDLDNDDDGYLDVAVAPGL